MRRGRRRAIADSDSWGADKLPATRDANNDCDEADVDCDSVATNVTNTPNCDPGACHRAPTDPASADSIACDPARASRLSDQH